MTRMSYAVVTVSVGLVAVAVARLGATPLTGRVSSVSVPGTGLDVKLATQVGQEYDARTITRDVNYLWSLDRFEDIRVALEQRDDGLAVTFHVKKPPVLLLHEIRMEPHNFGVTLHVPERMRMNGYEAHRIAMEAQRQMNAQGYPEARVDYVLRPRGAGEVDLKLVLEPGRAARVQRVSFEGDGSLAKELRAMRIRRILPGIPHVWGGWRLLPGYSGEAVDADAARLEAAYAARGYFDARVRSRVEWTGNDVRVWFTASPGARYPVDPGMCGDVLAARREAQRNGVLDFTAKVDAAHAEAGAETKEGARWRVGRIEFTGNHRYSDAMIRRNFLLDEGALLDERLLRRSLARLNRTGLFEPVDATAVMVTRNEASGFADVTVRVKEVRSGFWRVSGPVGPASVAGPVQAAIGTRLPAWGRGLLDLSTFTLTAGVFAFGRPLLPIVNAPRRFMPVVTLSRPFLPGEGWRSGFMISPQLGWRSDLFSYAAGQMQHRLTPMVSGEGSAEPPLVVTLARPQGDAAMVCEAPKPRFGLLRTAARLVIQTAGML